MSSAFHRIPAVAFLCAAAVLATAGASLADQSPHVATPGTQASVIAMNQKLKGDDVSVTYAYLPKDGTLAIFAADPSSASAKRIGAVNLTAGDHHDVAIKLSTQPGKGAKLWAAVEPANAHKPFVAYGKPAMETFKLL